MGQSQIISSPSVQGNQTHDPAGGPVTGDSNLGGGDHPEEDEELRPDRLALRLHPGKLINCFFQMISSCVNEQMSALVCP